MGTGLQLHEVEPGDVLHHAAAVLDRLGPPVDEAHADEAVAQAAGRDAPGACQPRRHQPAHRRLTGRPVERAIVRRLEGQHLAPLVERALQCRERRSRPGSDHHLGRLVERDSCKPAHGQGVFRLHRPSEASLRAAALDGERSPRGARLAHGLDDLVFGLGLDEHAASRERPVHRRARDLLSRSAGARERPAVSCCRQGTFSQGRGQAAPSCPHFTCFRVSFIFAGLTPPIPNPKACRA